MKYDRIRSISDRLDAGKITIDELAEYKILFNEFAQFVTESDKKTIKPYEDIIKKFLCMCNDYYIFLGICNKSAVFKFFYDCASQRNVT